MLQLKLLLLIFLLSTFYKQAKTQQISKEELLFLTPDWKGERFADGRPKVPDNIIKRMRQVSMEEAWAVMKNAGYGYQIAEGWQQINPDSVLVGRAVTATFMPARPNVWVPLMQEEKKQERKARIAGR